MSREETSPVFNKPFFPEQELCAIIIAFNFEPLLWAEFFVFMSFRTPLISIGITLALVGMFTYVRHENAVTPLASPIEATTTPLVSLPTAPRTIVTPIATSSTLGTPTIANATLIIGKNTYPLTVREGETVIEAMRFLEAENVLTFTGRDYPALGMFIDSINGEKNANGNYWILYINDISATSGVSAEVIHAGDRIEWKYNKDY
jgi:hypothetical protein